MKIDNFFMPVQIISGANCLFEKGELFKTLGKKAFVATSPSIIKNGYLKELTDVLENNDIKYIVFENCEPNPTTQQVEDMAKIARKHHCDFCVGMGGGSVVDALKAAAVFGAKENEKLTIQQLYQSDFEKVLPIVAIPTTAGSGTQATSNAVLTTDIEGFLNKKSVFHKKMYPTLAFVDARYTLNIPNELAIHTALDTLTHAVEGYLSSCSTPIGEMFAKQAIGLFSKNYKNLLENNINIESANELMLASTYAGIVIAQEKTLAPHAMSYPLTTHKNVPHGQATATLMAAFIEKSYNNAKEKVDTILDIMNLEGVIDLYGYVRVLLNKQKNVTPNCSDEELKEYSAQVVGFAASKPNPFEIDEIKIFEMYKKSLI